MCIIVLIRSKAQNFSVPLVAFLLDHTDMATVGENVAAERRGSEERSRSPARGEVTAVISPGELPLLLGNLPEHNPNVYAYRHFPESDLKDRGPQLPSGQASFWDPRGAGSWSVRYIPPSVSANTTIVVPHEAVPGGTGTAGVPGSASESAAGSGAHRGDGDGSGAPGGSSGGSGGCGPPAWDETAVSLHAFEGSTPVTVRFAEVVHWRQRVVYCRPDATFDHVKWAMRQQVGQHVSTFRINDGFSGQPMARHWYVTEPDANIWPNVAVPRRILVVMPSFM
jgi:hypothetical protein